MRRLWWILIACGPACAGAGGSTFQPFAGQFPSREEIAELRQRPPGAIAKADRGVQVDAFTPTAVPPADPYATATYSEPWAAPYLEVAAGAQGQVYSSSGMRCLAEELGGFYLAQGGSPTQALLRHLAAHCGVDDPALGNYFYGGETPSGVDVAAVTSKWGGTVRDALAETLVGGMFQAGFWFGQRDGKAVFAAAFAKRKALVSSIRVDGTRLTVSGQSLEGFERLVGMVTRGDYEYGRCEANPAVRLPRFELWCELRPEDPVAWVEVAGYAPGRFLGESLLTHRHEGLGFDPSFQAAPAVAAAGDFTEQLLGAINAWRGRAGLAPLQLEAAQSATNQSAAPHYFAGLWGNAPAATSDWVALGLMAGWDVPGSVARGYISTRWQLRGEPSLLVAGMTQLPFDRETLLNPRASRLAIGSLELEDSLGLVITSYEMFEHGDRAELARRVLDRLDAARAAAGRAKAAVDPVAAEEAANAAQGIEAPDSDPEAVIDAGLKAVVARSRQSTRSWVLPVQDLDAVELPEELVRAEAVQLGLSVVFHRDARAPWGMYYVLVYVLGGGRSV